MRIPMPVLSFYLGENDSKTITEGNKAAPVDGATGLRAALSDYLPEQRLLTAREKDPAEKTPAPIKQGLHHRVSHDQYDEPHDGKERRQEDRRKKRLPVLLDTRLKQCRHNATGHPSISCEI